MEVADEQEEESKYSRNLRYRGLVSFGGITLAMRYTDKMLESISAVAIVRQYIVYHTPKNQDNWDGTKIKVWSKQHARGYTIG